MITEAQIVLFRFPQTDQTVESCPSDHRLKLNLSSNGKMLSLGLCSCLTI